MATYRIDGVKYNPANWAALAPRERAACARFAAARERELNTITATEWVCHGGPFAGSTIELESTTEHSAALTVGAWCGRYELTGDPYKKDTPRRLEWKGNDAGAAINTHGASTTSKAAPDVTGRGFDQLRDLLGELAEDPAERATTTSEAGPTRPRARYVIASTTYTIEATSEAAQRLRARLVKAKRWFSDKLLAAPVAQDVPEVAPAAQDVPEVAPVAQDVPEVAPVAQDVPEVAPVAQDVPEVAPVAQAPGMVPSELIAAAALDLERITWTWTYDAARRMNIEAGRLGVPGALRYIRETLQRIATQGAGLEKTEAIKTLQSLAQAQAHDVATLKASEPEAQQGAQLQAEEQQAAATVATLVTIAQASATSAQQIEAQAPEVVAMAADGERGRIQRTGDTFADYWANSASASIERDITAGRARVVHLGAGRGAADVGAQAHTPQGRAAGAGGADTPTPPAAPDYSHPVETRAQAPDYSGPVETQGQPGKSARGQAAEVPRVDREECERQALILEAINLHGEALQWRCWAAGAPDLAERVGAINRQHERLGTLTPELEFKRQAISDELRARTTPPTDPDPGAPLHSPTQDPEQLPMNSTNTMTGAELQTLREISGLTRDALAELAGVEPRTVKHWETRKGSGVPDDVEGIVGKLVIWVLREAAAQLVRVRYVTHMTTTEELHPDGAEVVLIRYRETAHMPEGERAQGRRADVHGAMVARLVLDLMADGYRPRVVWFDPEAYTEWLYRGAPPESRHRVTVDDTPAARAAWAAHAIGRQASPHPGDQPPPANTPSR